jgi:HK97 family phage portal protein
MILSEYEDVRQLQLSQRNEIPLTKAKEANENYTENPIDYTEDSRAAEEIKGYIPYFIYKPPFGYPRNDIDLVLVRKLANSPYVLSVINTICDRINGIDWDIKPKAGIEMSDKIKKKISEIKTFLNNPNNNFESFRDLQRAMVRDILELDSGVLEKVFDKHDKKQLKQLFVRDGATILKNPDVHGYIGGREEFIELSQKINSAIYDQNRLDDPNYMTRVYNQLYTDKAAYFQYGWTPGSMPVPFGKRELIYVQMNHRSDSIYGRSNVMLLSEIILTLIYGGRYHLDFYINNNVPQGIVSIVNANSKQIDAFRSRMSDRIFEYDEFDKYRKKNFSIPIVGGDAKFTPWIIPSEHMQVLEQQKWFQRIVWQVFGIGPDEMGDTENANRATSNESSRILKKKAIKPYLIKLQYVYNNEIIPELDPDNEVEFVFDNYDIEEDYRLAEVLTIKLNYLTINEIRELEGKKPMAGGDMLKSQQGGPGQPGLPGLSNDYTAPEKKIQVGDKIKKLPKSDMQSTTDKINQDQNNDQSFDKNNPRDAKFNKVRTSKTPNMKSISEEELEELAEELKFDGDLEQLKLGMKVELEHKNVTKGSKKETAMIAIAHLKEIPDYYTRLLKMEKSAPKTKAEESPVEVSNEYETLITDYFEQLKEELLSGKYEQ